jgi:hypothetical protein
MQLKPRLIFLPSVLVLAGQAGVSSCLHLVPRLIESIDQAPSGLWLCSKEPGDAHVRA